MKDEFIRKKIEDLYYTEKNTKKRIKKNTNIDTIQMLNMKAENDLSRDGKQVKYKVYNSYRTSGDDATYMTRNTNGKREISLSTCTDDSSARIIILARAE